MELVYPFSAVEKPGIKEVGGKALSLILMTRAGFPVPPGFVLTTAFFKPWFDSILSSPEWGIVIQNPAHDTYYKALKELASRLRLDKTRKELVLNKIVNLKKQTISCLFAVRSSSPEEALLNYGT